ncbi:MAG: AmmeMemoRadiSam system radical SAM enzyme [Planctomycetota bacterium]
MNPLDRRHFLAALGRYGLSSCGLCALGRWGVDCVLAGGSPPAAWSREVDFYERLENGSLRCGVCPRHCVLDSGATGFCRSRTNVGGQHYARGYNRPCIVRVDPIEKVPLSHFLPGTETMTIAVGGCNLRCLYCQNWEQSQAQPDELKTFDLTPAQAVEAAKEQGMKVIAFNYTEPVVFLEYAKDLARAARKAELRVVAATAAFVEPEPLVDFAQYLDAITIGLKGFTEPFYETVCSIRLEPVLNAIKTIKAKTNCWLELVNLVVPTYNDDISVIRRMCGWIRRNVGVNTPLHFSRFVPMYRLTNLPRTPVPTLEAACQAAKDVGLQYVYTSNIAPHDGNNTYCAKCGTSLIQRLGFKILENRLRAGQCPQCRLRLPGVWT